MKQLAILVGAIALLATIAPPTLYMLGSISEEAMKVTMLVACFAWFITAPVWMKAK